MLGVTGVADSLHGMGTPTTIDMALVSVAALGAALLCPWLWLIATLSVLDALRGHIPARVGWTRRLTLLACGVAVTTSVVAPAQAATSAPDGSRGSGEASSLSGLPYPDRASSKHYVDDRQATPPPLPVSKPSEAADADRSPDEAADTGTYRVRTGDTLWAIAAATTNSADPSKAALSRADLPDAVAELHHRNRRVIGDDPDLIRPGQVLDVHSEGDEPR